MNAGTLLFVVRDLVNLMESKGVIAATGEFDNSKLDSIQEDTEFAVAVEGIAKAHGANVPEKVDKILQILPLLAAVMK